MKIGINLDYHLPLEKLLKTQNAMIFIETIFNYNYNYYYHDVHLAEDTCYHISIEMIRVKEIDIKNCTYYFFLTS